MIRITMNCPYCDRDRPLSKRIGNIVQCSCGSLLERIDNGWKLLEEPKQTNNIVSRPSSTVMKLFSISALLGSK